MAIAIEWQRLVRRHGIGRKVELPSLPLIIVSVILEPEHHVFIVARVDGMSSRKQDQSVWERRESNHSET